MMDNPIQGKIIKVYLCFLGAKDQKDQKEYNDGKKSKRSGNRGL